MLENDISGKIVDAAYTVHTALGPGLLESVYETTLAYEMKQRVLSIKRQYPIAVKYKVLRIENAFRADFLVNSTVIVELKSVEAILPMHKKQLLTYLRLASCRLGLLINFNTDLIKNGITRVVNGL